MNDKHAEKNSQCHNALNKAGFCLKSIHLSNHVKEAVNSKRWNVLDELIRIECNPNGVIFETLKEFCPVKEIEFIISLREAKNEYEEDGIWHDDGSRIMAFSLSLTNEKPDGGVLEFRRKGEMNSHKISTPDFGDMVIFKTGVDGYEHKINRVTKGSRLIIAGWCYPSNIS